MLSIAQKELIGVQKDSPAGLFEFAILILDKFCLFIYFSLSFIAFCIPLSTLKLKMNEWFKKKEKKKVSLILYYLRSQSLSVKYKKE